MASTLTRKDMKGPDRFQAATGQAVGWAAGPPMEEIGALLARYHATVRQIEVTGQRPRALPLADVPGILLSQQLDAARVSPDRAAIIRQLAGQLARDLNDTGQLTGERVVIHGDFTNHNVIARRHAAERHRGY